MGCCYLSWFLHQVRLLCLLEVDPTKSSHKWDQTDDCKMNENQKREVGDEVKWREGVDISTPRES